MPHFHDMVYQFGGAPVGYPGIPPGGTWYWVDPANGSSGNTGLTPDKALAKVSQAYAKCVTNKNDVVALIGDATGNTESAAITWSKSYTHLVGFCAPTMVGQRARMFVAAGDLGISPFITVSGSGCIFKNIYAFQGVDDAHALINFSVSGSRNYFENVHFAGGGHASNAIDGCASLQINGGSENTFVNCTVGVDTTGAATGVAALSVAATGGAARNIFRNCHFTLWASNAGAMFVELLGNSGLDRYLIFDNCLFINLGSSMTSGFVLAAGFDPTNKRVLLKDCALIGAGEWDSGNNGILYLNTGTITGGTNAGLFLVSAT